jgi:hypothetical protein
VILTTQRFAYSRVLWTGLRASPPSRNAAASSQIGDPRLRELLVYAYRAALSGA